MSHCNERVFPRVPRYNTILLFSQYCVGNRAGHRVRYTLSNALLIETHPICVKLWQWALCSTPQTTRCFKKLWCVGKQFKECTDTDMSSAIYFTSSREILWITIKKTPMLLLFPFELNPKCHCLYLITVQYLDSSWPTRKKLYEYHVSGPTMSSDGRAGMLKHMNYRAGEDICYAAMAKCEHLCTHSTHVLPIQSLNNISCGLGILMTPCYSKLHLGHRSRFIFCGSLHC